MTAGLDVELFWRSTIRTVKLVIAARQAAEREQENARIRLAWNIANLSRARRLPKPSSLYVKEPRRPQTWQDVAAAMDQWHAAIARKKAAAAALKGD